MEAGKKRLAGDVVKQLSDETAALKKGLGNIRNRLSTLSVRDVGLERLQNIIPVFLHTGHWQFFFRLNDGSRMNGDVHVRFCKHLA